jgi:hypothetical protein
MFAGCSKVTNVTGLFNQCSGLAVLPEKLFSDLTSLTAMGSTFQTAPRWPRCRPICLRVVST